MTTKVFDGRAAAQKIKEELKNEAQKKGLKPGLAVVFVGQNPSSLSYINQKRKACQELAWNFSLLPKEENVAFAKLQELLQNLNQNPRVHGIITQLPLPARLSTGHLLSLIDPQKDIDGLNPLSPFIPPPAQAVLHVLESEGVVLKGAHVVVLGRGKTAGGPIAEALKSKGAHVFCANSKTSSSILNSYLLKAGIIVSAVGQPNLIKGEMIKEGAAVLGVGISKPVNRLEPQASSDEKLNANRSTLDASAVVGDLDLPSLIGKASLITPTPGGIGPLTVAFLLKNLLQASQLNP